MALAKPHWHDPCCTAANKGPKFSNVIQAHASISSLLVSHSSDSQGKRYYTLEIKKKLKYLRWQYC